MNRSLRGADVRVGGEAPWREGGTRRGPCGEKSKTWSADFSGFSSAETSAHLSALLMHKIHPLLFNYSRLIKPAPSHILPFPQLRAATSRHGRYGGTACSLRPGE